MSMRHLRSVPFALLLGGCYTYAPVESRSLGPGVNVRARVAPPAAERIAPLLGFTEARVLTGSLVEARGDAIVIEVPTAAQIAAGSTSQTLYQHVSLAPGEVTELERRTLDRTRTALVVGAIVAAAGIAVATTLHGEPAIDNPQHSPGPNEVRKPIFRIRW
jgi:hypothetical protein